MLDLILLDYILLVDRFHRKELSCILLFDQQHCPEGSFSQNDLRHKVIDRYFFLQVVSRIEGLCGLPDHLFFFFLAVDILLEGDIIV
jgi:hypothetical protein